MFTLFALLLACTPVAPVRAGVGPLAFMGGPTADTGSTTPTYVFVGVGQSNLCKLIPKPGGWPYTLPAGVRLIRNGALQSYYTGPVGADAYLVDELIATGHDPSSIVLVLRCAQAVPIQNLITVQLPAIEADLAAFDLPSPTGLLVWQGERESRETYGDNDGAMLYHDDLMGERGSYSLRTAVEEAGWSGVHWSIVELAVRSTEYVDATSAALVRSAQYAASAHYPPSAPERICTIPSYGSTFLPGSVTPNDNPHVDLVTMEAISRRVVHGWVDAECP